MDWASFSANGLKFVEFLKKFEKIMDDFQKNRKQPKAVKRLVKVGNLDKNGSKWTGLFSVNGLNYRLAFGKIGSSQNKGKKENCLANFGIFFAEKRRIEGGIGEI